MNILVIPGLGDIHWVMLKMESFIAKHCPGERPTVYIWNFDGRPRSADFVERIPFVKFGGYWDQPLQGSLKPIFHEMYMTGKTGDIRWKFADFDVFLCNNGSLRAGKKWRDILPEYETNWQYEIRETTKDAAAGDKIARAHGRYVVAGFSDYGMFCNHWAPQFPPHKCAELMRLLPCKVILTGSKWDEAYNNNVTGPNIVNMVGKTPCGTFLAMLRRSLGMIGWCGGNTILSTHLGKPTTCIWSSYFLAREFWTSWVDPTMVGMTYHAEAVETMNMDALRKRFTCLAQQN